MSVPVIDLFAGPGGLAEGFSASRPDGGRSLFHIRLSIEKDAHAHQTLTLRSFFRQFSAGTVPEDYYKMMRGDISREELYRRWPEQAAAAREEAWHATLGEGVEATPQTEVDARIRRSLNGELNWLLIGGPPCQAYSVVGRSRRQEKLLDGKKDERVMLYKQYLRILAVHQPAIFVMENVKGLLSARTEENPLFEKILNDLSDPLISAAQDYPTLKVEKTRPKYRIFSLCVAPEGFHPDGQPVFNQRDFVVHAEKYGIPQTRHRVILLGIRDDIALLPKQLSPKKEVPIANVLAGLPRLRSALSSEDSKESWQETIRSILRPAFTKTMRASVKNEIVGQLGQLSLPSQGQGRDFIVRGPLATLCQPDWFCDSRIGGVSHHSSRSHMESDLLRYFYAACFARAEGRSPKLEDFPTALLPVHKNVEEGILEKKFADRFRVQLWRSASKTITSHISKDGHYYIHPDPLQCRSLTVREAARIQTFPDNYYFCGGRTQKFHQVGNAVPPLLAYQISEIVADLFERMGSRASLKRSRGVLAAKL